MPVWIELQRRRLFEATGVIQVTRYALHSNLVGLDETSVINALQVASRLVDMVASALERGLHETSVPDEVPPSNEPA